MGELRYMANAKAVEKLFLTCQVESLPSGEGAAQVIIPAEIMRRLRTRSEGRELGEYVWTDIIRPALYSHCY